MAVSRGLRGLLSAVFLRRLPDGLRDSRESSRGKKGKRYPKRLKDLENNR